jgi:hypothetical protein
MTNCTQIKFIFAKQTKKLTEEKGHGQQQINNLVPTKVVKQSKAVPLHAMEALGGRGGIALTHSRPRH